ncbi:MAG: galactokinase family protein [Acutalibacteraceae bacterium]|nr:galactokinase family protein [Acutalibacteraceae bacterium]
MKLNEIKNCLSDGQFSEIFNVLYTNINESVERYSNACDRFAHYFGEDRDVELFSAPGRTEVGGNHTDHQLGCVLAGGVNLDVIAVVSKNDEGIVRIKSKGFDMDVIDTAELTPVESEKERSSSLIRGVCARIKELGYDIGGFDAYTTSNVFKGSGLSSSAAFEVLVGTIISYIYNDGKIDAVTIAKCSQYAENVFFGKPSGLMDQMASSVGGFVGIDFGDKENPIIEKVDFDFAAQNHSLCIVNTGGNHADLTCEYAAVPEEMRNVAEYFGKTALRQVDEVEFYANMAEIREKCGDRAVLRSIHFFDDNRRAVEEKKALQNGDFNGFLNLVRESGRSSFMFLQNVYAASAPVEQGLSIALALSGKVLGDRGAYRVHGGGFGGTIQAFVPNDLLESYINTIEGVFGKGSCYVLKIRPLGGTKISK